MKHTDDSDVTCLPCEGQGQALIEGVYRSCNYCAGSGVDMKRLAEIEHTGPTYRLRF